MKELQLSNGAHIRVRPMPPHVTMQFNRNVSKALPPEPKPPRKSVKMADGHVEEDAITEGPEWDAYQEARAEWKAACESVIVDANDDYNILQRDYSIIEWSFNGEHWQTDVPDAWEYPPALERGGVKPCGNKRVDFIGIELLTTGEDWTAARGVAENTANITDEEAGAVRAGFRTGNRRTRDSTSDKVGWFRRLALKIPRRDGGSESVGAHARRVVSGE